MQNTLFSPNTQKKSGAGHRVLTYLLLLLLAFFLVSGCAPLPSPGKKQAVTPNCPASQLTQAPHLPYRTITIGLDISSSYPRSVFKQAKRSVADSIDKLVQPDSDGATVYLNWITDNSWSPDSAAMPPIVIPALPAAPAKPVKQPYPPPSSDPYQDAQARKAVDATYAKAMADYCTLVQQQQAQLGLVHSQVKQQTDRLRLAEPQVDMISTDEYGFVQRASQRLQVAQGTRILVLATDLDNSEWSQWVPDSINLKNVRVRVVFHYCQNAPTCASIDAGWQQVFQEAGSRDIRFLDPDQSLVTPTLFA